MGHRKFYTAIGSEICSSPLGQTRPTTLYTHGEGHLLQSVARIWIFTTISLSHFELTVVWWSQAEQFYQFYQTIPKLCREQVSCARKGCPANTTPLCNSHFCKSFPALLPHVVAFIVWKIFLNEKKNIFGILDEAYYLKTKYIWTIEKMHPGFS